MRRMSNRTKEIIIKTNIVICIVLLLLLVPGSFIFSWFLSEKLFNILFYGDLILFAISGVSLMILLPILGLKRKPVKAERIPLSYSSFEELSGFLQSVLIKNQYQSHESVLLNNQGRMLLFTGKKKLWELNCFAVIRIQELTDDILEQANDEVTKFLVGYYGTERITDWISMIVLVYVDRITPPFQRFVNNNVQQGFKNYRLPVGVSFGGKTLYIAKQKDGFASTKYKKLRKDFLEMLDITCGN